MNPPSGTIANSVRSVCERSVDTTYDGGAKTALASRSNPVFDAASVDGSLLGRYRNRTTIMSEAEYDVCLIDGLLRF